MMPYKFSRLDTNSQSAEFVNACSSLLPDSLKCCLYGKDPEGLNDVTIISVVATHENQPIGIAIASCLSAIREVYIRHLFVLPEYRHQKVGSSLFALLEKECKKKNGRLFFFVYPESPTSLYLDKILANHHWNGSRPFMISSRFDGSYFETPWFPETVSFPDGYQSFAWSDIKAEEKLKIIKQHKETPFLNAVFPFKDEQSIAVNSRGLRYKDEVVGWMITHKTDDTIRYTAMYIEPSQPKRGILMLLLLAEAIIIHRAHPSKWAIIEIPLIQVPNSWKNFVEKRLVPYALETTYFKQAWLLTE